MVSTHDDDLGDISNCVRCHPTGEEPDDGDRSPRWDLLILPLSQLPLSY